MVDKEPDTKEQEMSEGRVVLLEETVAELGERVARLEAVGAPWLVGAAARRQRRPEPEPVVDREPEPVVFTDPVSPEPRPEPVGPQADHRSSLEDLVGGRLLAWAGGLAVLAGIVLLFAIAVTHGWIGEGARTLLGAAAALGLTGAGIWLHEQRGRTEAALVAAATGLAALFVTVTVAAQVYDLVPPTVGIVLAVLVAAGATVIALRWRAEGIAALGLGGGLLAPVLVGAAPSFATMVLLWVAAAGATLIVVDRRWGWLALLTYVVATVQWVGYLVDGPATTAALATVLGFAVLTAAAAVGHELRHRSHVVAAWSSLLLVFNALGAAAAGWIVLGDGPGQGAADLWLAVLALAHIAGGAWMLASPRRHQHAVGLAVTAVGVLLTDLALGLILHGPVRALAYAACGVALAALARRAAAGSRDASLLGAGLGGHLALAIAQLALQDASPAQLGGAGHGASVTTLAALLAVAGSCFAAGRLAGPQRPAWRTTLDTVGLGLVAYLTALGADGTGLVLAWAGEAAGLALLGRRQGDQVAEAGAVVFAGLVAAHALVFDAPPGALVDGLADAGAAFIAVGAFAALALGGALLASGDRQVRAIESAAAAVALLYLASVELITFVHPAQEGQVLLSAMWALTGTVAVVVGLRREQRALRLGGLGLLLVALAKLVAFDLATLTSGYRVGSCVVIGLLLLLAGFVWQRLRPRARPDLRTVPPGLR